MALKFTCQKKYSFFFFVGVKMVPKPSTYYQQHDPQYLLSVLSLGAFLSLVLIDTVCVRCFRKKVWMELENQWEEQH